MIENWFYKSSINNQGRIRIIGSDRIRIANATLESILRFVRLRVIHTVFRPWLILSSKAYFTKKSNKICKFIFIIKDRFYPNTYSFHTLLKNAWFLHFSIEFETNLRRRSYMTNALLNRANISIKMHFYSTLHYTASGTGDLDIIICGASIIIR
jgi:hypothetical protein